jgi:hypothetical protein
MKILKQNQKIEKQALKLENAKENEETNTNELRNLVEELRQRIKFQILETDEKRDACINYVEIIKRQKEEIQGLL